MSNCENHLCRVLDKHTELYLLDGTLLILTCKQTLVIEEEQLVDVLDVGCDSDLEVIQHLVIQHGSASYQVDMQLFGNSLHL